MAVAVIAVVVLVGLGVVAAAAVLFLGSEASEEFVPVGSPVGVPPVPGLGSDLPYGNQSTLLGDDYGDNPTLDRLWDRCADGHGESCDELFWRSELGSAYEDFGNTCGERFPPDDVPYSCEDAIG